jgi:hypothetical protein
VAEKGGVYLRVRLKTQRYLPLSHKEDYRTLSLRAFVAEKGGCLFTSPVKDTKVFATKSQSHKERL